MLYSNNLSQMIALLDGVSDGRAYREADLLKILNLNKEELAIALGPLLLTGLIAKTENRHHETVYRCVSQGNVLPSETVFWLLSSGGLKRASCLNADSRERLVFSPSPFSTEKRLFAEESLSA